MGRIGKLSSNINIIRLDKQDTLDNTYKNWTWKTSNSNTVDQIPKREVKGHFVFL